MRSAPRPKRCWQGDIVGQQEPTWKMAAKSRENLLELEGMFLLLKKTQPRI